MDDYSFIAYKETLLIEEHNKAYGCSADKITKWIEKGQIGKEENELLLAISILIYSTRDQLTQYLKHTTGNNEPLKKIQKLIDFGLVRSFTFVDSKDDYRTSRLYCLTLSGHNYVCSIISEEQKWIQYQTPLNTIRSKNEFLTILSRVSFNGFYVNSLNKGYKVYLSYPAGKCIVEGRYLIQSKLYSGNQANVFVIAVRNTVNSSYNTAMKIRAIQDHCVSKRMKAPWFILICENTTHGKQVYLYLHSTNVIDNAVVCITCDEYLSEDGIDPFDNLSTFELSEKGVVSNYIKIVF